MNSINFDTKQTNYWIPVTITLSLGLVLGRKLYQIAKATFDDKVAKDKLLKTMTETNNKLKNENTAATNELKQKNTELKSRLNKLEDSFQKIERAKIKLEQSRFFLYKERRELLLTNVNKTRYIYDRFLLQKTYALSNANHPRRIKPLKIVIIPDITNLKVNACFKKWTTICSEMMKTCVSKQTNEKLSAIHFIIDMTRMVHTDNHIAAAIDDDDEIQAISFSCDDTINNAACKIEYLVSSPLNIRENGKQLVEGAGTALIQYAIERALSRQNLTSNKPIEIVDREVAVTLHSIPEAVPFYHHVGFVDYKPAVGSSENMILIGDKLVEFLKKYGGRYSI